MGNLWEMSNHWPISPKIELVFVAVLTFLEAFPFKNSPHKPGSTPHPKRASLESESKSSQGFGGNRTSSWPRVHPWLGWDVLSIWGFLSWAPKLWLGHHFNGGTPIFRNSYPIKMINDLDDGGTHSKKPLTSSVVPPVVPPPITSHHLPHQPPHPIPPAAASIVGQQSEVLRRGHDATLRVAAQRHDGLVEGAAYRGAWPPFHETKF